MRAAPPVKLVGRQQRQRQHHQQQQLQQHAHTWSSNPHHSPNVAGHGFLHGMEMAVSGHRRALYGSSANSSQGKIIIEHGRAFEGDPTHSREPTGPITSLAPLLKRGRPQPSSESIKHTRHGHPGGTINLQISQSNYVPRVSICLRHSSCLGLASTLGTACA
jgi:hypothetical protein